MPQTQEHLAIVDLLGIENGIVVLTKTDLVDDPDWLELVQLDITETLENTALANAPIIPISAKTGENIPKLVGILAEKLKSTPPRPNTNAPHSTN